MTTRHDSVLVVAKHYPCRRLGGDSLTETRQLARSMLLMVAEEAVEVEATDFRLLQYAVGPDVACSLPVKPYSCNTDERLACERLCIATAIVAIEEEMADRCYLAERTR